MAPPSSNTADDLLASARDGAESDGLRAAVDRFLDAVDALVAEDRRDEAATVLAEMLAAKEKKRGFLFGKREQSALGDRREAVANKYAQIVRNAPPSEGALDVLAQLAAEFPNDFDVRIANAEELLQAGYLLDALDEFKTCKGLHRADVDLDVKLGEVYAQLGRLDDAVGHARRACAEYAKAGNDAAAADLAVRLLGFAPDAFDCSFEAFGALSADLLVKHRSELDRVASSFAAAAELDPARRSAAASKLAACYEKLIVRDRSDERAWQALTELDADTATRLRERLDGKPVRPAAGVIEPVPTPADAHAAVAVQIPEEHVLPAIVPSTAAAAAVAQIAPHSTDLAPAAVAQSAAPVPDAVPAPAAPAAPATRAPAAAGGLAAFAKRKALEMFLNSDYEAAVAQLLRVVKMSPDVESLEMLLECYLVLDKHDDAARVGVQLADAEIAAGNKPGAIATLTTLSKRIANPALEQRRVELMQRQY